MSVTSTQAVRCHFSTVIVAFLAAMVGRLRVPIAEHMTRRRTALVGLAALLGGLGPFAAKISLAKPPTGDAGRLDVTIAVPDFVAASADVGGVAHQMAQVVANDLRSGRHFALVDRSDLSANSPDTDIPPRFEVWRATGVQALVAGRVNTHADGRLSSQFRLWEVASEVQLLGQIFVSRPEAWRRVAHTISSAIYETIVGEKHDFGSGHD